MEKRKGSHRRGLCGGLGLLVRDLSPIKFVGLCYPGVYLVYGSLFPVLDCLVLLLESSGFQEPYPHCLPRLIQYLQPHHKWGIQLLHMQTEASPNCRPQTQEIRH